MLRHRSLQLLRGCCARIRSLSPAAIILGSALNTLEAVSLGLLIFPPTKHHDAFTGLQTQAISLFIMSTVISQAVLTLGGSSLPFVLSSMLAEVLPFLRSIASVIQNDLGNDHPNVLPTTMVAFAMASVLLGSVFLLLAALRCGNLVGYFPETVMTGVIGAVGVSLFILGLEIPSPASSPHLSFGTLFSIDHLPLLAASLLPAIFISITTRVDFFVKGSRNLTKHPLYMPIFCFGIAAVFWIVVAAYGDADVESLASTGWLFPTKTEHRNSSTAADWNYWALFDFAKVEWGALSTVSSDLALLVAIGALSLPIFASAAAIELDVPEHSMNHDLVGHGIANILAGIGGTLPALMIYSNTRFFARAGGRRDEAGVVTLVMLGVFFISSHILPYVPTILASALILYIGMELLIESLWESGSSLVWDEWITVAGTTLACSFIGFAPGIGIGLAITVSLYFLRDAFNSRPRITEPCTEAQDEVAWSSSAYHLPPLSEILSPQMSCKEVELSVVEPDQPASRSLSSSGEQLLPPIIRLTNHVGFADKPIIERFIQSVLVLDRATLSYIILDFRNATTVETRVAEFLAKQAHRLPRQHPEVHLVLVGVKLGSKIQMSLSRGGLDCSWTHDGSILRARSRSGEIREPLGSLAFESTEQALDVCRFRDRKALFRASVGEERAGISINRIMRDLEPHLSKLGTSIHCGLVIREIPKGKAIACGRYPAKPTFLVLHGEVVIQKSHDVPTQTPPQQATRNACRQALRSLAERFKRIVFRRNEPEEMSHAIRQRLTSRQLYDEDLHTFTCAHALGASCWILDVDPQNQAGLEAVRRLALGERKSKY